MAVTHQTAQNFNKEPKDGTAAKRYEALSSERDHYLDRARQAAAVTIPHIMPPDTHNASNTLPTPFQSVGARGVRNLASKMLLALFPPNTPFFKYEIDDFVLDEIEQASGANGRGEVEKALGKRARAIISEMETSFFRPVAFEVFRQLIVPGNALLHIPEDGFVQVYKLDSYVVKRDYAGTVIEIVVKQLMAHDSLPEDAKKAMGEMSDNRSSTDIPLYTHIYLEEDKYKVYQEVDGKLIQESKGSYTKERLPWLALRMTAIHGEDYGRSYIDELIGDLISLEGLSQAMVEGSAALSRILYLVNPGTQTNPRHVEEAANGSAIAGKPEDIQVLQAEKRADFSVVRQQIEDIRTRLSFSFLLNTSIQRDEERVTAAEIRYMAQEIEDSLGGLYSLLAQELQLPVMMVFEKRMEKTRNVPKLPKKVANPRVVTGLDALGRGQDQQRLEGFLGGIVNKYGPEAVGRYVNLQEAIYREGVAWGIDMDNLIRTPQEIEAAEQQARMEELARNLGPQAIQQMGGIQQTQMKNEAAQEQQQQQQQNEQGNNQ
jgi:hypothetical protein